MGLNAGATMDRTSVEGTALRTAEMVGGSLILQELIDLEGLDLEGRDGL